MRACWHIACALVMLGLFPACQHDEAPAATAHSVDGGSYSMITETSGAVTLKVTQGDNARTPTRVVQPDGTTVEFGTSRDPLITIPEAPSRAPLYTTIGGLVVVVIGAVLIKMAWPRVGFLVLASGAGAIVIGNTVDDYGWLYAATLVSVVAFGAWMLASGWRIGERDGREATA